MRGYIRELVKLPAGVTALRWCPLEADGIFEQSALLFTSITPAERRFRALYRVIFDLDRFMRSHEHRKAAKEKLLLPLLKLDLESAYRSTVELRGWGATKPTEPRELWSNYLSSRDESLHYFDRIYRGLEHRPLVSVVMVADIFSLEALKKSVQGIRAQIYREWELTVICPAPFSPEAINELANLKLIDARIEIQQGTEACSVPVLTNFAIRRAGGRYIALVTNGSILEPQALLRLVQTFRSADTEFAYSDGVVVEGVSGNLVEFELRPSFSLEYLRSHPYIDHLVAFDRLLWQRMGIEEEAAGAFHIYDFVLRAAEQASVISHISEILYRRAVVEALEDGGVGETPQLSPALDALGRHLKRVGVDAVVETNQFHHGYFRLRYPLRDDLRVAIIIPTKNNAALVRQCIESIRRTAAGIAYELIVVDHDSDEPESMRYFSELERDCVVLKYHGDFNFSKINNFAVSVLGSEYSHYLFCNNDIEAIEDGWLITMLGYAQFGDVGVVGAQLLYPDRVHVQHAGVCVGLRGVAEHYGKFLSWKVNENGVPAPGYRGSLICAREMSAVTAACMLVREEAFAAVYGYDDRLAVGFGDVDLCLRILQFGYRIVYCPDSRLVHHESYTRGASTEDPHPEDTSGFMERWAKFIQQGDPFFNPAFSDYSSSWELKDPLKYSPESRVRSWSRTGRNRTQVTVI